MSYSGLHPSDFQLLKTISKLLGHASFTTKMIYLHCRREHLIAAPSPLDWLTVKQLPTYQPPEENGEPEWNTPLPSAGPLGDLDTQ